MEEREMKKIFIIIIFALILFSFNNYCFAHPGNTDSSGGHTCRTNCTDWGLYYGEYHYHNTSNNYNYFEGEEDEDKEYEVDEVEEVVEVKVKVEVAEVDEEFIVESRQRGYFWGYSDYENGNVFDDTTERYEETSFKEGYRNGWFEAGGGTILKKFEYWLFEKHLQWTKGIGIGIGVIFILLYFIIVGLRKVKRYKKGTT